MRSFAWNDFFHLIYLYFHDVNIDMRFLVYSSFSFLFALNKLNDKVKVYCVIVIFQSIVSSDNMSQDCGTVMKDNKRDFFSV